MSVSAIYGSHILRLEVGDKKLWSWLYGAEGEIPVAI